MSNGHPLSSKLTRVLAFGLVLMTSSSPHAGAPRSGTFWLGLHGGVTFNTTIDLSHRSAESELTPTDSADPSFGISFNYRTTRLDFGLLIDSFGAGAFQGLDRTRGIGGRSRIAANLGWRFFEDGWGALSLHFRPGLLLANHNDHLRSQVAVVLNRQPTQLSGIDSYNSGFVIGSGIGIAFYLRDFLSVYLEVEVVTSTLTLQGDALEVRMRTVQPLFNFGLRAKL